MLLTATELRAARIYWHVQEQEGLKIYPSAYKPKTVGMLWQTMAQCQTWFGSAQFLAYGIQLLPLTAASEHRDSLTWSKEMYGPFAESCRSDPVCAEQGWYILELAILATVGHAKDALESAATITDDVFESAGGNGHSLSNTLWYFATRPKVDNPLRVQTSDFEMPESHEKEEATSEVTDCGKPDTCTDFVLDTIAGLYSCRQRIDWLIQERAKTETEACLQVAGVEHPFQCSGCNPESKTSNDAKERRSKCPPCDFEQCSSGLNQCPIYDTTFICIKGGSRGGCSDGPWEIHNDQCEQCCELTDCWQVLARAKKEAAESNCPPCPRNVCRGTVNKCPSQLSSQSLCLSGPSNGGCSLEPWAVEDGQCTECCTLLPGCEH
jgi:Glycosyl hydrolase family 81 C-terminal domain